MLVYIMRHGEAESLAGNDNDRELTPLGAYECALMGQWASTMRPCVDCIWVSPYIRAKQSLAALRANWTSASATLDIQEFLTPNGNVTAAADALWDLAYLGIESVLVVSHMPLISFLVEKIDSDNQSPMFDTSSLACIELNPKNHIGNLLWLKTPSECI